MNKRSIIAIFVLLFCTITSMAQNDFNIQVKPTVFVKTYKESLEGSGHLWLTKEHTPGVKVMITNQNSSDIFIFSKAVWAGNEGKYVFAPKSYVKFDNGIRHETGKIVLSKNFNEFGTLSPFIHIKAGETYTVEYEVYGEQYGPIRSLPASLYATTAITKLKVEVHLMYHYSAGPDNALYEDTFYTETNLIDDWHIESVRLD